VSGLVLISEGKRQYNNAKTLITNAKYTPAETAERSSEQCCEFGYFYLRNYKNSSNPHYKVFHPKDNEPFTRAVPKPSDHKTTII